MTDTTAITGALDPPAVLGPGARAALRTLAAEYARSVLDTPAHSSGSSDYRHVILVLVHELERDGEQRARNLRGVQQARQVLAGTRPLCPGSNDFVPAGYADGSGIATCPSCLQYRPTVPLDGRDNWRVVAAHTARHLRECFADGGALRCVCPIQDSREPF